MMRRLIMAAILVTGLATTAHAQDEAKRYSMSQIHVGDRVSIPFAGHLEPCRVIGVRQMPAPLDTSKIDAVQLRCDKIAYSGAIADSDHLKLGGGAAPSWNVTNAAQVGPKESNGYGARNPVSCGPVAAPALTPAVAVRAFTCGEEKESGHQLWLVQNVSVRLLGPTRYDPHTQTGFTNMDTRVQPVAISGSYSLFQCSAQEADPKAYGYNYDRNCSRYDERNAKGYCWKNRAGAWSCTMSDLFTTEADKHHEVGPPR